MNLNVDCFVFELLVNVDLVHMKCGLNSFLAPRDNDAAFKLCNVAFIEE